jgi:hypothetical protein
MFETESYGRALKNIFKYIIGCQGNTFKICFQTFVIDLVESPFAKHFSEQTIFVDRVKPWAQSF